MTYRFGPFILNRATRQLLRDADEVHLSPKAFELLAELVANRSRALSKAELLQRLWPATFVEETNLAGLVAEIRRALGDSAQAPVFVRTVHRFGYRFAAEAAENRAPRPRSGDRMKLSLTTGAGEFLLVEGVNVIGRDAGVAIQVDSAGVSRHHARIVVAGGEARIEDLGSKNGTYLRGVRVTGPSALADGDDIRLGRVVLTVRIVPISGPTETVTTA